jgi:hypothetical protein
MKTLWCKNQENPSDRISHTWAPLRTEKRKDRKLTDEESTRRGRH